MRRASILSTFLGTVFLIFALAALAILRWQIKNTLEGLGEAKYVELSASASLERIEFDLLIFTVVASALLLSGLLMLYRRKFGLYLALCSFVVLTGTALFGFVVVDAAAISLVKMLGWAYVFYFVLRAHRRDGANWWLVAK